MERAVYLQAKHLQAPRRRDGPRHPARHPRRARFPGEVVTVPYGSRPRRRHGRVLDRIVHYPRFSARVGEAVARLVRERTVDIVDAQGLTALGYGRLRGGDRALRAPLVMNPQGMEEHKAGGLKRLALTRLRALSREAARLADRVVATDEATRDEVPRLLGVPADKVVVLPNGVDPDEIARAHARRPGARRARGAVPGAGAAAPLLLSVGRIEAYKGFDDVLGALAVLHDRQALPAGLDVGGRGRRRAPRRRSRRRIPRHSRGAGAPGRAAWTTTCCTRSTRARTSSCTRRATRGRAW